MPALGYVLRRSSLLLRAQHLKVILPDALLVARSPKPLGIGDPTQALLAQSPSVLRIPTNLPTTAEIFNEIFNPN